MGKVKQFVSQANKQLTIKFAATLLASSTLISALLGIYRDRILNTLYLDTYAKPATTTRTLHYMFEGIMLRQTSEKRTTLTTISYISGLWLLRGQRLAIFSLLGP